MLDNMSYLVLVGNLITIIYHIVLLVMVYKILKEIKK